MTAVQSVFLRVWLDLIHTKFKAMWIIRAS